MVAIIDYGAGNIRSVENAVRLLGREVILTKDPDAIRTADHVILPGVGAFGDAMERIRSGGMEQVICDAASGGVPFLGICLGLQLLFEESEESPGVTGLGVLGGKILRFPDRSQKVPQIGWNDLYYPSEFSGTAGEEKGRLFRGIPEHSYVYFVHSFYLQARDRKIVSAGAFYGTDFDASIESGNLFACQFHPEKSETVGLKILQNFLEVSSC